jgi:hypothetical protein
MTTPPTCTCGCRRTLTAPTPPTGADTYPYTAADTRHTGDRCHYCNGPIEDGAAIHVIRWPGANEVITDRPCWTAANQGDTETLTALRAKACAAGFHRSPGQWSLDPADPYGDASLWECVKGCGYVRWAPGTGTNRWLAEHGVTT